MVIGMSQTEYVKQTIKVNWDKILTKLTKLNNPEKGTEIGGMLKTIFRFSLFEKIKPDVEEVETIIRQGWDPTDVVDVDVSSNGLIRFNYPNGQYFFLDVDLSTNDLTKEQYLYYVHIKEIIKTANEVASL